MAGAGSATGPGATGSDGSGSVGSGTGGVRERKESNVGVRLVYVLMGLFCSGADGCYFSILVLLCCFLLMHAGRLVHEYCH